MENILELPVKRVREALAYKLQTDQEGVRKLLAKNGFDASKLKTGQLSIALLKAIKESPIFRSQLAEELSTSVDNFKSRSKVNITPMSLNFINQPEALGYVAEPVVDFVSQGQLGFVNQPAGNLNFVDAADPTTAAVDTSTIATPAPAPAASGGGFWNSLGSLGSKENINKLFNTGLDTLSTSIKNSSNASSEQNALELERLRLEQIKAKAEADKGLPTWGLVSIVAVAAGLIGTGIYFAMKKKKA